MSIRELVSRGAACVVLRSSSSSSYPLGTLTNALIGSSSKTKGALKEIPNTSIASPHTQFYSHPNDPVAALPSSELDRPFLQSNAQGSEFIRGFALLTLMDLEMHGKRYRVNLPLILLLVQHHRFNPPLMSHLKGCCEAFCTHLLTVVETEFLYIPLHFLC